MSVKEKLIRRGTERPRRVIEIETRDGDVIAFTVPHTGPEKAVYRRLRENFVTEQRERPNMIWVQKGLMPEGGYPDQELGLVFDLHYLSDQGWSQQDVLEMLKENPEELQAIYVGFYGQLVQSLGESTAEEIDEKKGPSSNEESNTGTTEPA